MTVTGPLPGSPGLAKTPPPGTAVAIGAATPASARTAPAARGLVETRSTEYLKPTAANSGVTPAPVHGSPSYGFEPPAMPIQTSWVSSASTDAQGDRSASG